MPAPTTMPGILVFGYGRSTSSGAWHRHRIQFHDGDAAKGYGFGGEHGFFRRSGADCRKDGYIVNLRTNLVFGH